SRALMRSPTSRIRACSAAASCPAFFARPIASEAVLRRALRSSTSFRSRRRSTSLARISGISSAPPFWTSARWTSSGRSRMSRRSSTGLLGFGRGGAFGLDAGDRADLVVGIEVDDAHAHRVTALRRHVVRVHADDLAFRGDHEEVGAAPDLQHAHHRAVAAARLDVDDALTPAALQPVLLERRPLAVAALGHGQDLGALLHDVGRDDLVALVHLDAAYTGGAAAHRPDLVLREADGHAQLGGDHDLAGAVGAARGDDVDLQPVHLAEVGEEEEVRVRGGDEEVLDDVFLFRLHAGHALAPAALAAVGLDVRALDVARARDGDDHLLVGEEVLDRQLR